MSGTMERSLVARSNSLRSGRVRLQIVHRVADGLQLVGVLVGNVEAELFLERHDEFHDVERIGAEILDEFRFGSDLLRIHLELLRDDLLHPLFAERCHGFHLLGWGSLYITMPPSTVHTWPVT